MEVHMVDDDTNPGRAMARLRWRKRTALERSAHCRMMAEASNAKRTPEERSEAARKAARALWAKRKSVSRATENDE
jgi:hypothetical protein